MNHRDNSSRDLSLQNLGRMFYQSGKDFFVDNGPQWAAAIAYYSLLSLFPLILAAASIASFFVSADWVIEQATSLIEQFLPQGSSQIEQVVSEAYDARGSVSILSILTLLWTGSRVFGTVTRALNIAFDSDDTYGFLKRTLVEFLMLLTLGILFVLALASRAIITGLWGRLAFLPARESLLFPIFSEVLPAVLLLIAFFLTYRFVPRREVNWKAALLGSAFATLLFLIARPLFQTYVQRFANYNLIYGSLAIVILIVFWAWLVSVMLIIGGEVASHYQDIIVEGQPVERVDEKHQQRSPNTSPAEDSA